MMVMVVAMPGGHMMAADPAAASIIGSPMMVAMAMALLNLPPVDGEEGGRAQGGK